MLCSINGCDREHSARSFCKLHYYRFKRHGDANYEPIKRIHRKLCSICDRIYYAKNLCHRHYNNLICYKKESNRLRHIHTSKIWKKNNPRTWDKDFILYHHMNNVRVRDNNKCRWYGCESRDIDVHHIFLQSEYPELKYIEKYMICYCRKHHKEWHKARGDNCHYILGSTPTS